MTDNRQRSTEALRAHCPQTSAEQAAWLAEAARRYEGSSPGAFNEQAAAPAVETLLERAMRDA